jgi:hypothetical protein
LFYDEFAIKGIDKRIKLQIFFTAQSELCLVRPYLARYNSVRWRALYSFCKSSISRVIDGGEGAKWKENFFVSVFNTQKMLASRSPLKLQGA